MNDADINLILSKNLKRLRNSKSLTQREVADVIGITQHYYSDIENGKRRLQINHLPILSEYFNVKIDIFFES
ncbi:MAG TPA: helix-turn-helix transcriptional regulator [Erysipelothrix sp.]